MAVEQQTFPEEDYRTWAEGRDGNSGKEIEFNIIIDNDRGRSATENIEP